MTRVAFCFGLLAAAPALAGAGQDPFPRVHLGAQIPALDPAGAAGMRFELRRNPRESLEVALEWRYSVESGDFIGGPDTRAYYSVLYKRRFLKPGGTQTSWFATIGGLGYYKPAGDPEILYQDEDGRPFAQPIRRGRVIAPPIIPLLGVGIERTIGKRAGVHLDIQIPPTSLMPFVFGFWAGPSAHAGIYVPLRRR